MSGYAPKPFDDGFLQVSDIHRVHYEQSGKPDGEPVIFLHGGPGGGTSASDRVFFDPTFYRIILLDQRGAGKSTPHAELRENTTWDLVEDIERLRRHLQIDTWVVFGGSWGSTLSLSYAETHPERVRALILRGLFTLRREELLFFYQKGSSFIMPDYFEEYESMIPEAERDDMMAAYYKRLTGDNEEERLACAKAWSKWECATSRLYVDPEKVARAADGHWALAFARIECHYFVNGGFFKYDGQLIAEADKIRHIPTTLVQGRYDLVCPMKTAWDFHKKVPEAEIIIVDDNGHSAAEEGIQRELIAACDRYRDAKLSSSLEKQLQVTPPQHAATRRGERQRLDPASLPSAGMANQGIRHPGNRFHGHVDPNAESRATNPISLPYHLERQDPNAESRKATSHGLPYHLDRKNPNAESQASKSIDLPYHLERQDPNAESQRGSRVAVGVPHLQRQDHNQESRPSTSNGMSFMTVAFENKAANSAVPHQYKYLSGFFDLYDEYDDSESDRDSYLDELFPYSASGLLSIDSFQPRLSEAALASHKARWVSDELESIKRCIFEAQPVLDQFVRSHQPLRLGVTKFELEWRSSPVEPIHPEFRWGEWQPSRRLGILDVFHSWHGLAELLSYQGDAVSPITLRGWCPSPFDFQDLPLLPGIKIPVVRMKPIPTKPGYFLCEAEIFVYLPDMNVGSVASRAAWAKLPQTLPDIRIATHHDQVESAAVDGDQVEIWAEEVKQHLPHLKVHIFHGTKRIKNANKLKEFDIVITTPHLVGQEKPDKLILRSIRWHRIVLDESHLISSASRQGRKIQALAARNRWCLTGTPVQRRVLPDLAPQFSFLRVPFDPNYGARMSAGLLFGFGPRFRSHCDNLIQPVLLRVMVRHTLNQALEGQPILELPPISAHTVMVDFSPAERAAYDQLAADLEARYAVYREKGSVCVTRLAVQLSHLTLPLRRACAGALVAARSPLSSFESYLKRLDSFTDVLQQRSRDLDKLKFSQRELQEDNCPICLDVKEQPVETPCHHQFCFVCITSLVGSGIEPTSPCPLCRRPIKLNGLKRLATAADQSDEAASGDAPGAKRAKTAVAKVLFDSKIQALLMTLDAIWAREPLAKVLVFSQFSNTLTMVGERLKRRHLKFATLVGSMERTQRTNALAGFAKDPSTNVFLLSTRAGAVGINLTEANHVVLMDPCVNPATEQQAIGRVHRLGQTRPVHVHRLLMRHSIDTRIARLRCGTRTSAQSEYDQLLWPPTTAYTDDDETAAGERLEQDVAASSRGGLEEMKDEDLTPKPDDPESEEATPENQETRQLLQAVPPSESGSSSSED
ncbi:uncharacterized protein MONBRDRAFT_34243 [Monosiga brevicollis MX1]|uniref:Proline iminopeptidase n=1 Tax=Monosiga brevicollis TaxID=81824 RepID=A9VAG0_MONBE|nr:uncharacterized protein MONBRDRAFT_34243 [Monosiga brevicollis MX1]EDQ85477.1 predicted protein [Monosiga brevicollis MX1]|eukprot:XP_001749668.1 hypothetical protein [Monosiga brevicollis MX1]